MLLLMLMLLLLLLTSMFKLNPSQSRFSVVLFSLETTLLWSNSK